MDILHSDVTPSNIFYTCYIEICRRMLRIPSTIVKPATLKDETFLELEGDELKVEDWTPVLVALRSDNSLRKVSIISRLKHYTFLHDIDTEEKAINLERLGGALWTNYVLCQLTNSIAILLRHSDVLTILELDGLPMFLEYLEHLLEGLKKNKTLKNLTVANCALKDKGCKILCEYLQNALNVEAINFTKCDLTSKSGEYIARLILKQQVHRVNCWPDEDLQSNGMDGIKQINLNCNHDFKDKGFHYISEEMENDMWIKSLYLQSCGITDNISSKILEVINNNKALEIVDLRHNYLLNTKTVERVQQLLHEKYNNSIMTRNSNTYSTCIIQTQRRILEKYFNTIHKEMIENKDKNKEQMNDFNQLPSTSHCNDLFPQLIDFDLNRLHLNIAEEILNTIDDNSFPTTSISETTSTDDDSDTTDTYLEN